MNQPKRCFLLDVRSRWNLKSQIYTTLLWKVSFCARGFLIQEKEHLCFVLRKQYRDSRNFKICVSWSFFFSMITKVPSEKILRAGKILRNTILSRAPHMIRDRKYHLKTYRCVSWLYRGLWIFMPAILWFVMYAFAILAGLKRSEIILWCYLSWMLCSI